MTTVGVVSNESGVNTLFVDGEQGLEVYVRPGMEKAVMWWVVEAAKGSTDTVEDILNHGWSYSDTKIVEMDEIDLDQLVEGIGLVRVTGEG